MMRHARELESERRDYSSSVSAAALFGVGVAMVVAVLVTQSVGAAVMTLVAFLAGGIGVGFLLARDPNRTMFDVDEEETEPLPVSRDLTWDEYMQLPIDEAREYFDACLKRNERREAGEETEMPHL
jgi:hypothetical protein